MIINSFVVWGREAVLKLLTVWIFLFAATVYYYIIYVHKMRKLKHGLDLFKNNKTNIYKNKLNKRHSEWK
jgi:hypothetical protein